MREHLDLLFEQHLSRLVACCVYGTTRKHNVVVSIKVGCRLTCISFTCGSTQLHDRTTQPVLSD